MKQSRDPLLIDALEEYSGISYSGSSWRLVRSANDPLKGQRSIGRWDPGEFDVLYTSMKEDGAIAEIASYLFSLIPVPAKPDLVMHQLSVSTQNTIRLVDTDELGCLGVNMEDFQERNYQRTREIGDVAYFLDFDGLIVPSARYDCNNLILFTDKIDPANLEIVNSEPLDIHGWRAKQK